MKRSAANYEETGLLVCGNDVKLQLFVELSLGKPGQTRLGGRYSFCV